LFAEVGDAGCIKWAFLVHDFAEAGTVEKLHDKVGTDGGLDVKVCDKHDIFVLDAGGSACFSEKACGGFFVAREDGMENLDGKWGFELDVLAPVHDATRTMSETLI
jgi:hypothetical protein